MTTIEGWTFSGCTNLPHAALPDSLTSIRESAFQYCTGLTEVTIPNSVTDIGGSAFAGCVKMNRITLPNGINSVANATFSECTGLTRVTIPDKVTNIASSAFSNCTSLTNVTLPSNLTVIGQSAFSGCSSLNTLTIPRRVINVGPSAFSNCTSLTELYFRGGAPGNQGGNALVGSDKTTVYYLPRNLGWGPTFGGRPTALWLPRIQMAAATFGVHEDQFGFDVSWVPDRSFVVEVATRLTPPDWYSLQTVFLTGDTIHFSDPEWTSQSVRIYRLRLP